LRRLLVIAALMVPFGLQYSLQARGHRRHPPPARYLYKESTVDMSARQNIFLGWVDIAPEDWARYGYADKGEWERTISRLNMESQSLCHAQWLAGRTIVGAKDRRDENAAGQDLHIRFADVRLDYDNYLLYLSIHFVDPKTNSEIASVPVRPYYGDNWGIERYLRAALEEVNRKIQVEVTGVAAQK